MAPAAAAAGDGPHVGGSLAYGLFCRSVAACGLASFASLWPQLPGLVGPAGIQPAVLSLQAIRQASQAAGMPPWAAALRFPTVFHWMPECTSAELQGVAAAGALASALGVLGVGTALPLVAALACWVSLLQVCGDFLCYPWDWMLAELLAVTALLPQPTVGRWRLSRQVPPAVDVAVRFLAFRLMLGMGLKKFYDIGKCTPSDGCGWGDGSYLRGYYIWQPMVTPGGWLAHHAGDYLRPVSTWVVFVSQTVLPFGFFGPGWLQRLVTWPLILEQVWIQFIGNFGVFNMLSAALLSFPFWASGEHKGSGGPVVGVAVLGSEALAVANIVCGAFFLLRPLVVGHHAFTWLSSPMWLFYDEAVSVFEEPLGVAFPLAAPALEATVATLRAVAPLRICNPYGIFRTSPGFTPGLKVVRTFDGLTEDGTWRQFAFPTSRWQATGGHAPESPGLPPWFSPHQPRLDQSVFYLGLQINIGLACFDNYYTQRLARGGWLPAAIIRALLEGGEHVQALLAPPLAAGSVRRARTYLRACWTARPPGGLLRTLRALAANGSAPMWAGCDPEPAEPPVEATLAEAREYDLKERRAAQKVFDRELRREWAESSPGLDALVVPTASLLLAGLLQALRLRRASAAAAGGGRAKTE